MRSRRTLSHNHRGAMRGPRPRDAMLSPPMVPGGCFLGVRTASPTVRSGDSTTRRRRGPTLTHFYRGDGVGQASRSLVAAVEEAKEGSGRLCLERCDELGDVLLQLHRGRSVQQGREGCMYLYQYTHHLGCPQSNDGPTFGSEMSREPLGSGCM